MPAGLLDALQNETPPSQRSPTSAELLGPVYQAPSEPSLLADGLIEPVSPHIRCTNTMRSRPTMRKQHSRRA